MKFRVVEETHEIQKGEYLYRILSNHSRGTHILKRTSAYEPLWSHAINVEIWDGERFMYAFKAAAHHFDCYKDVVDILEKQEGKYVKA